MNKKFLTLLTLTFLVSISSHALAFSDVSGHWAEEVINNAEKMKIISNKHQTLCITHLPAIAAQGDNNFYIYKEVKNGKTRTNIKKLNEEETIFEIARISNGDITDVAIENAKELRKAV